MPHEAVSIKIRDRIISVDRGMASTITWLNRYHDIITHWSCEGGPHRPYVTFSCHHHGSLHEMLVKLFCETPEGDLVKYCTCEVGPFDGKIRYTIYWPSVENFKAWKREGPLKEVA